MIEMDGIEIKFEFGTSVIVGCFLFFVKLELLRRGFFVLLYR